MKLEELHGCYSVFKALDIYNIYICRVKGKILHKLLKVQFSVSYPIRLEFCFLTDLQYLIVVSISQD